MYTDVYTQDLYRSFTTLHKDNNPAILLWKVIPFSFYKHFQLIVSEEKKTFFCIFWVLGSCIILLVERAMIYYTIVVNQVSPSLIPTWGRPTIRRVFPVVGLPFSSDVHLNCLLDCNIILNVVTNHLAQLIQCKHREGLFYKHTHLHKSRTDMGIMRRMHRYSQGNDTISDTMHINSTMRDNWFYDTTF